LIFINPFLKICSEFVQDFINFILFAALKIMTAFATSLAKSVGFLLAT